MLYSVLLVCDDGLGQTLCPEFNSFCRFSRATRLQSLSLLVRHSSSISQQILLLSLACYFLVRTSLSTPIGTCVAHSEEFTRYDFVAYLKSTYLKSAYTHRAILSLSAHTKKQVFQSFLVCSHSDT